MSIRFQVNALGGDSSKLLLVHIYHPYPAWINPLNAELNPIRHLLALVGARHIVHVSRIRVKVGFRLVPVPRFRNAFVQFGPLFTCTTVEALRSADQPDIQQNEFLGEICRYLTCGRRTSEQVSRC